MKKIFEYFGLISLICFSFFITEQTVLVVQEIDDIMITIKSEKNNYETTGVDALIVDNTIIPGLSEKKVNINKSYQNMKEKGIYDSSFYVYDISTPNISATNNMDKYIIGGNIEKKMVSLVFVVDNKSIDSVLKVVGDTPVAFVINSANIDREIDNIIRASKLNDDIIISANNYENYFLLDNKLRAININLGYCFNDTQDSKFLKVCQDNSKYSIYSNKVISSSLLKNVKKDLLSGKIFVFKINEDVLKELSSVISYIKSRGYTIETLFNHLNENW